MSTEEGGLRPGLCSVTFRQLPPDDVLGAAVAAQLDGIEWGGDIHVPPGDEELARRLGQRCADAGIACPSYGSYLAAGKSGRHRLEPVLATAVALGAGNVRVWCPFGAPPGSDDDLFGRAADDLAAWAVAAGEHGLTVSTEFHVDTFTETAESTAALLDAAGRPDNLFTYWQPVRGRDLAAESAAVHLDVSHVHVFQWADDGDRRPLLEGEHWPALLAVLATATRFEGDRYAFLEFVRDDGPEQLIADAEVLRRWLA